MKKNLLSLSAACWLVAMPALADVAKAPESVAKKAPASITDDDYAEGFAGSYLASQYARRTGDFSNAIAYLKEAHEKDPDNLELAKQLEGLLLLNGDIDEAIKVAQIIHTSEESDAVSALLLSLKAINSGNNEKANAILAASFKAENGQLWLPLVSYWLDLGQGKLTKPVEIKNIKSATGRAAQIVHYHLALINDMAGFDKAATHNFLKAMENEENPPMRVMQALADFYDRSNQPPALKPVMDAYTSQHPDFIRGDIGVHSVGDGLAEVLFTMGSIMLGANLDQDAAIYLRLALYLKPDFPLVQVTLGDAYSDMQQYAMANEIYSKVKEQQPLYYTAQINQALNYHRMERTPKALEILDRVSKNKTHSYNALVTKGDIMRESMRFEDAIDAYSKAMAGIATLDAAHWGLLFARGASYERLKHWPEAEKDLQQALSLSRNQPEVLNYLGYLWLMRGKDVAKAKEMIGKALSQRPNDPQIMDSMGWAYYLTGDYNKAAGLLEKAVGMIPADPTVNDHLGDVYWQQGRRTEARFQWERSLSFSPEPDLAAAIEKKLKEGLTPPNMVSADKSPALASQAPTGTETH